VENSVTFSSNKLNGVEGVAVFIKKVDEDTGSEKIFA
jgi:hypothetical protein